MLPIGIEPNVQVLPPKYTTNGAYQAFLTLPMSCAPFQDTGLLTMSGMLDLANSTTSKILRTTI